MEDRQCEGAFTLWKSFVREFYENKVCKDLKCLERTDSMEKFIEHCCFQGVTALTIFSEQETTTDASNWCVIRFVLLLLLTVLQKYPFKMLKVLKWRRNHQSSFRISMTERDSSSNLLLTDKLCSIIYSKYLILTMSHTRITIIKSLVASSFVIWTIWGWHNMFKF